MNCDQFTDMSDSLHYIGAYTHTHTLLHREKIVDEFGRTKKRMSMPREINIETDIISGRLFICPQY